MKLYVYDGRVEGITELLEGLDGVARITEPLEELDKSYFF
jgi:hypothetical protein